MQSKVIMLMALLLLRLVVCLVTGVSFLQWLNSYYYWVESIDRQGSLRIYLPPLFPSLAR